MVPTIIQRLWRDLGEALFPDRCLACGDLFRPIAIPPPGRGLNTALARHFCPVCRGRWTVVESPLCRRCGLAFKGRRGDDHWCGRCLERPGTFHRARAAGIYDQTLRVAIQALKFKAKVQLADPLGRLLIETFEHFWIGGAIDLATPVPLHPRRFRRRGFNQAHLLLRHWPASTGVPVVRDLLVRTRDTAPQSGLDRRQRRINIKQAFAVRHPGRSLGQRVLLVDDVLTTGATAEACAAALLRDGARRVDVLTLARAPIQHP